MTVELGRQTWEFFLAAGLGLGLGVLYDLGRGIRRERPRLTPAVDIGFALCFFLGLWLTAIYTDGLRLYQAMGCFLGAAAYFLTVSPPLLGLWRRGLRGLGRLGRRCALPMKKSVYFLRKVAKKLFPSSGKWGTIKEIPLSPKRLREKRR